MDITHTRTLSVSVKIPPHGQAHLFLPKLKANAQKIKELALSQPTTI